MTVGRRVALLVSLSVALSVIAMGVAAYITTRITLFNKLDSQLTRIASTVSGPIQVDMKNLDGVGSRSVDVTDEVIVNLVRADNSITAVSGTNRTVVTEPSELAVARLGWGISSRTGVDSQNEPIRIVAVPLSIDRGNSDPVEHYALVIGEPLDTTYGVLQSLWIILIVAGAVGVIATTLTGLWAANNTIRPIRDLSRAVHEVAETGEITPIKVHSDDELGELAASVNVMLTNLEKSRERQKRLIGDASHELRTPLTSMRTNVELLLADQKTGMLPEQARGEILTDIAAQLGEFSSLIGDLVQLSREDAPPPRPEIMDLADVVARAVQRAKRRGLTMVFDVQTESQLVLGDSQAIERSVTNLLDNAVKFSPSGGRITVRMADETITVADEGPGISDEDLPHIFDRFYRSDQSRNTPGTGLGLSIVAHTVNSHGGWIKASRAPGGGALFTMHLPTVDPYDVAGNESAGSESLLTSE